MNQTNQAGGSNENTCHISYYDEFDCATCDYHVSSHNRIGVIR